MIPKSEYGFSEKIVLKQGACGLSAMIDLRAVQAELSCARQARIAAQAAGCEIEALVLDMQRHAWHRVALVDEAYDPHLFQRVN
jgi:hypothetical protein